MHTRAHMRPGCQCALTQCTHAHGHMLQLLPELLVPSLQRGCRRSCRSRLRALGVKLNTEHAPTSESEESSRPWVAAQSAFFSQGLDHPVGGCPEIHRPAKALLRPPRLQPGLPSSGRVFLFPRRQQFQAQPDASGRREWATCSVG